MTKSEILMKTKTTEQWWEEYDKIKQEVIVDYDLDEDGSYYEEDEDEINRETDFLFKEKFGFDIFDTYE